ncbi:MAG: single-stranded DNA-binding protein [Clostridia bacterium]|nr:single-stranded DNA-binding protein [Clostridia bacterium]
MNSYVTLVGRIVNELTIDSDTKNCEITIAISREFKNEDGIYETDYIPVTLKGNIAKNVVEYCKKGDLIAIKGRIETSIYEKEDGTKIRNIEIIANKATFLSSKN